MKYVIVCIFLLTSLFSNGQIDRIFHFTINSPDAGKLYSLFKDTFQLPTVWNFSRFGDFESGGLSLGNVVVEFAKYKNTTITEFGEIGLEPHQSNEQMVSMLDKTMVNHGVIDSTNVWWSTVKLEGTLPKVLFLISDFKERRQSVSEMRKKAADSLSRTKGGNLGITGVKEIVIGCKNLSFCNSNLMKIPGIRRPKNNVFKFNEGPAIRLVAMDKEGIKKIVLTTSSVKEVTRFFQQQKMFGSTVKQKVSISHPLTNGLQIELTVK